MGVVAVITVITQHINMTFRHILQTSTRAKLAESKNIAFLEKMIHLKGYHPKLKVNPSASNWDSSSFLLI
jgi:hypothetical protein